MIQYIVKYVACRLNKIISLLILISNKILNNKLISDCEIIFFYDNDPNRLNNHQNSGKILEEQSSEAKSSDSSESEDENDGLKFISLTFTQ
jgi:hypothetical protein